MLYNKSLKCCLYSMSLTVISQLSPEPTPHHAVTQYDYMANALLKICMTFMLLYPMVAAQCLPYSISQQLQPLSWLSRTSHTPRFIPITPACPFSLLCWFWTPLPSENGAVPQGSIYNYFCFLSALIPQMILSITQPDSWL